MADENESVDNLLQMAEAITTDGKGRSKAASDLTESVMSKTQSKAEDGRGEVSALTIGRMLGVATSIEMKVLEGKLDLVANRVNNLTIRMDKIIAGLTTMPAGSDFERIDVQLGQLRQLLNERLPKKDVEE